MEEVQYIMDCNCFVTNTYDGTVPLHPSIIFGLCGQVYRSELSNLSIDPFTVALSNFVLLGRISSKLKLVRKFTAND